MLETTVEISEETYNACFTFSNFEEYAKAVADLSEEVQKQIKDLPEDWYIETMSNK